jgi:hypothetical protein
VSPSLIDRDEDDKQKNRPKRANQKNGPKERATRKQKTPFAVRPRTRLSFAYFSLEDKEK